MDGDGAYGDGAMEFAGGGFMPAPSAPTPGAGGAFSPSAGGARRSSVVTVQPVTVRHLATLVSGGPGSDGAGPSSQDIQNVVLVGRVVHMETRSTDLTITLDDGTGKIEVRKWHDDQESERDQLSSLRPGTYVKVNGLPRKIGNNQLLTANSIRPITDFNEVTCHYLDCIFVRLYSQKGQGRAEAAQHHQQQGAGSQHPHQPPQQGSWQLQHPPSAGPRGPQLPGAGGAMRAPAAAADSRLPLHERVLKFFAAEEARDPEGVGVHRDLVARSIPGVSPDEVMLQIQFLVNEGHLYSTIDEMHFKTLGDNQ